MNEIVGQSSITYTKDQIGDLRKIFEQNGKRVGKSLLVAISMDMWADTDPDTRLFFLADTLDRMQEIDGGSPQTNFLDEWIKA